jgi:dTDP-4-amino-4,6-dideoxygalactose transaminase
VTRAVSSLRSVRSPIPFLEPDLPELRLLLGDFERIYRSNVYSNGGPFERRFAERLAAWIGVAHAIPVANATLGLVLAIKALALPPPRRKVLLPSFTFVATALAVEWAGYEPLFCDVDPEGWQATADLRALEPHAASLALLLPCNTFGAPVDLAAWGAMAAELGVPVLLDSAPGLGASYPDGSRQGHSGFTEVFSMHATKPFAVGEGGVVTTEDPVIADRIARLRNFGCDDERLCRDGGTNAKLTEMASAIALRVLDGFEDAVRRRRALGRRYADRLVPMGFREQRNGELSAYQFFPAKVPPGVDPARLIAHLAGRGIQTRDYYARGLHQHPHFASRETVAPLPETEQLAGRLISLPMSTRRTEDEVDRVCDAVAEFLEARP